MKIIDLMVKHNQPMKFNEILAQTNMVKSNLYKYLNTLTDLGLLYREKRSGLYMLGSKLIEYGMAAVDSMDIIERTSPFLLEINRTCNETVLLVMWTIQGPMIVKILNGNKSINIGAQLGSYLPIQSASGKIFAAFMNEEEIKGWKQAGMASMTPEQQVSFLEELERVKTEHISFAREALVPHVYSVSFPVLNHKAQLVAGITLVGFEDAIPTHKEAPLSQYLLEIKSDACQAFGFKGES
jgi:DNA-binding IclR family transcriptional regulator